MNSPSLIAAVVLYSGIGLFAMQDTQSLGIELDHVILGINNLERGIQDFESRTGVTPKRGGEHPGRGTQNALVTLGNGHYLEILAPSESTQPGIPRDARTLPTTLTFVSWALRTRAIQEVPARLRPAGIIVGDPVPGSRRTPDGTILQWQAAAVKEPTIAFLPFFIQWSEETVHPSTSAPAGCTLAKMEFAHSSPAKLQALFNAVGFSTRVATATDQNAAMRLTLDCLRGRVEFGS